MGDFMAVHTIEHLQTITLVGLFLNNRDRADAAWSLLGAAIKVGLTAFMQVWHRDSERLTLCLLKTDRWPKAWVFRGLVVNTK